MLSFTSIILCNPRKSTAQANYFHLIKELTGSSLVLRSLLYPSFTPNVPLHPRPAVLRSQEPGSLTGKTVQKPKPGPGVVQSVDRGWRPIGPGRRLECDASCLPGRREMTDISSQTPPRDSPAHSEGALPVKRPRPKDHASQGLTHQILAS